MTFVTEISPSVYLWATDQKERRQRVVHHIQRMGSPPALEEMPRWRGVSAYQIGFLVASRASDLRKEFNIITINFPLIETPRSTPSDTLACYFSWVGPQPKW